MFDALCARAAAAELTERIGRGRVQAVLPLEPLTMGFEIYAQHARHYLLASAGASTSRLHLVAAKLRASGEPPTSFTLLLRKYAVGALVHRIEAVPRERIVRIEFDHHEEGLSTLVAELMGPRSNLVLLDAGGTVLDAIKRVTSAMSRARTILPREPYRPPPPQAKIDPPALTSEQLARILDEARGEPLWQVLVRTVAGTSPLFARELAFRVTGTADAAADLAPAEALRAALVEVWRGPADPTLAYEGDEPRAVAAFALTHLPKLEHVSSISAALEKFYGAVESYEAVKEPLRRQIAGARDRLARTRAALERELAPETEIERMRESGELILAHLTDLAPGQKRLRAERLEGGPLDIALDPARTPLENAQRYFSEYRRAKDAAARVPERIQEVESELAFAEEVLSDLELAESRAEIEAAEAEARDAGWIGQEKARRPTPGVASEPRAFVSPDGFQVLVGRNARQNEVVTFERAGGADLWLHARGTPGAHVVVLTDGREVPPATVEFAAALAAFYSGARGEAWVDVIATPRRNVRRAAGRGSRPGLVTVREEKTVRVRPDAVTR